MTSGPRDAARRKRRRAGALALAALALVAATPFLSVAAGPAASAGAPALVLAPPWRDAAAAAEAAGGRVVGLERAALAALAVFPDAEALARLRRVGAIALDGRAAASFCGVNP